MDYYFFLNICYADDTVVIASSVAELQSLMDRIVENSERFGLYHI